MLNFNFCNPTRIVFGKGTICEINKLIPADYKVMVLYGGGSIKKNGVYDQVMAALAGHKVVEFSGIEANPRYKTCLRAVEQIKNEQIDFLLAVGGGSVIDATKFISAATHYEGENEPWDIVVGKCEVTSALSFGSVLTLPATGSEMNCNSVVSREETQQKRPFSSDKLYPVFSILDPEATYSLPKKQLANGIIDAFVHVVEQYLTYDVGSPLQDRQAEAILSTLIEIAPDVMSNSNDYDSRANFMWAATNALNFYINCGVVQDWTSHEIGHEVTAFHGMDHGCTLAVILPAVLKHQRKNKEGKLLQYAERIWGITEGDKDAIIDKAILKTEEFFISLDVPVRFSDYNLSLDDCQPVIDEIGNRGDKLGENINIGKKETEEILTLAL